MADFLRQYLCCCLPQARPVHDSERQPLLDPDVLPQAPPRAPPTRTTEEQEAEHALRRRILNLASERLINILSPNPFTSAPTPSTPTNQLSPPASSNNSLSSSPTLTSHTSPRRDRSKRRSANSNGRSASRGGGASSSDSWRPTTHDPIAPVRVVHLGKNWEVLGSDDNGYGNGDAADASVRADPTVMTPSTMRKQRRNGARLGSGRPPSSHSMRTLPRGGGAGSNQPSPLRGASNRGDELLAAEEDELEGQEDDDDDDETDSRFGTATSYRTAASGSRGGVGSRIGLRDIWGTAMGGDEPEMDPKHREDLEKAIKALEASVDDFKITPVGPLVADLADHKPPTK
ncbi:hypothetical protein JCM3766R1_007110 [Sporobolomyces carnicolor]